MPAEIDLDDLPAQAQEIAQLVGLGATTALVASYGGIRLYVPQKIDFAHPLAQLIGVEAAQRLAQHYGGDRIEVPRCADALRRVRNRAIAHDARMLSQRDLARKYQLTERAVRLIWRSLRTSADDRQTSLF